MITTIKTELSRFSKIKIGPSATVYMAENAFEYMKNPAFITDKIILGNCSKVLIGNNVRHVIINVDQNPVIEHNGDILHVSSGLTVDYLMEYLLKNEIGGLQYLAGIPATIGGLIWMNGGAFGHHIWEDIIYIRVIDMNGKILWVKHDDVKFSYRFSDLRSINVKFIVDAFLKIHKASYFEIAKEILEKIEYRKTHHPINYPSLGSTFKNSTDILAWKVIQEIGLVNYKVGDAKFSEKHPNFIVNLGNATFDDVKTLVELAMERSLEKLNLKMDPEIILID